MSDEDDVSGFHVLQRQVDRPVGALTDLRRGLAAGASVRPYQPVRHRLSDLHGGGSLVISVIPFADQRIDVIDSETGKVGGDPRALAWATDDERVVQAELLQGFRGRDGLLAAAWGELKFGAAGVFARFRPLCFSVSEQDQSVLGGAHCTDSAARRFATLARGAQDGRVRMNK